MDVENTSGTSVQPVPPKGLRPSDYLVGPQLDEALANGEDIQIYWPFDADGILDWVQAEAIW